MSLVPILETAIGNLRSGRLEREEDVKIAVILPVLQALGWDNADTDSFRPEYPAGPGRVDYALLSHGYPQAFVEAKRPGALDVRAEAQLFGYASNNGVPLLVLSDGYCWDFYLSMAAGPPEARRFQRLELRDAEKIPEYADVLETCLRRQRVASGEARRNAEMRLESDRNRITARDTIPEAWNALLTEPDELLCELLAEQVQRKTGIVPERSDVEKFLTNLAPSPSRPKPAPQPPIAQQLSPKERTSPKLSGEPNATPKSKAIMLVNSHLSNDVLNSKNTTFSSVNATKNVWWLNISPKKFEQELHILCAEEFKLFWLVIEENSIPNPESKFKLRKDKFVLDIEISYAPEWYMHDVKSGGTRYDFHPHIRRELLLSTKLN